MRGVIRIKGSNRGLAMALDGNGRWCYLDPKLGAMHAVAEPARNVAVHRRDAHWRHQLPELRQSREAAHHVAVLADHRRHHQGLRGVGDPITGGNVSFYNETLGEGIYPTPVMGIVGVLEDVHKAVRIRISSSRAHALCYCGGPSRAISTDAEAEFGSSEYAKEILGALWGFPPALDWRKKPLCRRRSSR